MNCPNLPCENVGLSLVEYLGFQIPKSTELCVLPLDTLAFISFYCTICIYIFVCIYIYFFNKPKNLFPINVSCFDSWRHFIHNSNIGDHFVINKSKDFNLSKFIEKKRNAISFLKLLLSLKNGLYILNKREVSALELFLKYYLRKEATYAFYISYIHINSEGRTFGSVSNNNKNNKNNMSTIILLFYEL